MSRLQKPEMYPLPWMMMDDKDKLSKSVIIRKGELYSAVFNNNQYTLKQLKSMCKPACKWNNTLEMCLYHNHTTGKTQECQAFNKKLGIDNQGYDTTQSALDMIRKSTAPLLFGLPSDTARYQQQMQDMCQAIDMVYDRASYSCKPIPSTTKPSTTTPLPTTPLTTTTTTTPPADTKTWFATTVDTIKRLVTPSTSTVKVEPSEPVRARGVKLEPAAPVPPPFVKVERVVSAAPVPSPFVKVEPDQVISMIAKKLGEQVGPWLVEFQTITGLESKDVVINKLYEIGTSIYNALKLKPQTQEQVNEILLTAPEVWNDFILRIITPIPKADEDPMQYASRIYDNIIDSINNKPADQRNELQNSLVSKLATKAIQCELTSKDKIIRQAILNSQKRYRFSEPDFASELFVQLMNTIECDFKACSTRVVTSLKEGGTGSMDEYISNIGSSIDLSSEQGKQLINKLNQVKLLVEQVATPRLILELVGNKVVKELVTPFSKLSPQQQAAALNEKLRIDTEYDDKLSELATCVLSQYNFGVVSTIMEERDVDKQIALLDAIIEQFSVKPFDKLIAIPQVNDFFMEYKTAIQQIIRDASKGL